MSVGVLYQADILLDGVAASTDMNRVRYTLDQDTKEFTSFGDVARRYLAGLTHWKAEGDYYYQTGVNLLVNLLEAEFGTPGSLPSFTPSVLTVGDTKAEGGLVFFSQAAVASAEHDGKDGDQLKGTFKVEPGAGVGNGRSIMGTRLLRNAQGVGTSGTGTPFQIGAVAAGQSVFGALNVIGTTGGAAGTVFTIQSAASSGMAGAVTRLTFAVGTSARTGDWQSLAGAIADTWWQAKWTGFAGTAFTVSISAGIQ